MVLLLIVCMVTDGSLAELSGQLCIYIIFWLLIICFCFCFFNIFPRQGCQTFLPSSVAKTNMLSYQCPCPNPCAERRKTQSEWFDDNQFVNVDFSAQRPELIDPQGMFDPTILWLIFL